MKAKEVYWLTGAVCFIIILGGLLFNFKSSNGGSDTRNNYSDTQILEARNFVADFDDRMKKVTNQIERCAGNPPKKDILTVCTRNAYDSQGWESGYYDSLSEITLNPKLKNEYSEYKNISMKVLSTEL